MLPIILKNDNEETRVENKNGKKLQTKQKNNYEGIRVKNKIKIPKLPSLQTFLKQYNNTTKDEILNYIFNEDKKLSINNLL